MSWRKEEIATAAGLVDAKFPVIVSAVRSGFTLSMLIGSSNAFKKARRLFLFSMNFLEMN